MMCENNSNRVKYFKQVCIPGLHLSLGIFNRLWTLLEDACNKLDLQLAEIGVRDGTGGSSFSEYSTILSNRSQLATQLATQISKAAVLEQLATFMALNLPDPSQNQPLCAVRREASVARTLADLMVTHNHIFNSFTPYTVVVC